MKFTTVPNITAALKVLLRNKSSGTVGSVARDGALGLQPYECGSREQSECEAAPHERMRKPQRPRLDDGCRQRGQCEYGDHLTGHIQLVLVYMAYRLGKSDAEHHADHETTSATEAIAQRPRQEHERRKCQGIGVDDPLQCGDAGRQLGGDAWQGDVDDRHVELPHDEREAAGCHDKGESGRTQVHDGNR